MKCWRAGLRDILQCFGGSIAAEKRPGWHAQFGIERMCEDHWRWQATNPKRLAWRIGTSVSQSFLPDQIPADALSSRSLHRAHRTPLNRLSTAPLHGPASHRRTSTRRRRTCVSGSSNHPALSERRRFQRSALTRAPDSCYPEPKGFHLQILKLPIRRISDCKPSGRVGNEEVVANGMAKAALNLSCFRSCDQCKSGGVPAF